MSEAGQVGKGILADQSASCYYVVVRSSAFSKKVRTFNFVSLIYLTAFNYWQEILMFKSIIWAKPNTSIAVFGFERSIYNFGSMYPPGNDFIMPKDSAVPPVPCVLTPKPLCLYTLLWCAENNLTNYIFNSHICTHAQIFFLSLRPGSPSLSSPVVTKFYNLSSPLHLRPRLHLYWIIIMLFLLIS